MSLSKPRHLLCLLKFSPNLITDTWISRNGCRWLWFDLTRGLAVSLLYAYCPEDGAGVPHSEHWAQGQTSSQGAVNIEEFTLKPYVVKLGPRLTDARGSNAALSLFPLVSLRHFTVRNAGDVFCLCAWPCHGKKCLQPWIPLEKALNIVTFKCTQTNWFRRVQTFNQHAASKVSIILSSSASDVRGRDVPT